MRLRPPRRDAQRAAKLGRNGAKEPMFPEKHYGVAVPIVTFPGPPAIARRRASAKSGSAKRACMGSGNRPLPIPCPEGLRHLRGLAFGLAIGPALDPESPPSEVLVNEQLGPASAQAPTDPFNPPLDRLPRHPAL